MVLGKALREMSFGNPKRYRLYSGLFVLSKLRVKVSHEDMREIAERSPSL